MSVKIFSSMQNSCVYAVFFANDMQVKVGGKR